MASSAEPDPREFSLSSDGETRVRGRAWFAVVDGRPAVVGLELWSTERQSRPWWGEVQGEGGPGWPSSTIRAEDLHSVRLGQLRDEWARHVLGLVEAIDIVHGTGHVERFESALAGQSRTGRPRLSRAFLEQVASVYLAAVAAGSRRPAIDVRDHFSADQPQPYDPATVRGWIRRAAKEHLLTEGRPGAVRGPVKPTKEEQS